MNKIIFLDVDGVLNSMRTLQRFGWDFIDPILVALVARIVRETEAKIVLSSTWRMGEESKKMVEVALAEHNLEILDITPVLNGPRQTEIQAWLDVNPTSTFAIIDDDIDAEIEGSFFRTDDEFGLTVTIAERVIEHLKKSTQ